MKSNVTSIGSNISELGTNFLLFIVSSIVVIGLCTQIYFVYLNVSGNNETAKNLSTKFDKKFNGYYKNTPGNIFYSEDINIWVDGVTNQVKIGKLAGNRNLEFGVKNVLEEYLQEGGYSISETAPYRLKVEIIYLDVLTTKKNISVFHSNEEEVVIRLRGLLYKDGKKIKDVIVEESSSEVSMSTLIVDGGGKFNQTSLSNALKKGSGKLITKLFQ
jgi:hypothetical protein